MRYPEFGRIDGPRIVCPCGVRFLIDMPGKHGIVKVCVFGCGRVLTADAVVIARLFEEVASG